MQLCNVGGSHLIQIDEGGIVKGLPGELLSRREGLSPVVGLFNTDEVHCQVIGYLLLEIESE